MVDLYKFVLINIKKKMKINKLYKLYVLTSLALLCFCSVAIAQTELKGTLVDEQGNPISGVSIFGPNRVKTSTDNNGQFLITLEGDQTIIIQKEGYQTEHISIADITENITLKKVPFLTSDDDIIKMGVVTKKRREIVGAISATNTKDRLTYDNTQFVLDYINGLTVGVRGTSNIRGIGQALFVIDGVFGRDPRILNMEEVEQITILKDANAVALYGSQGRNGVVIINTKRGKINKKEINVNIRSGIRTPVALPNYLGSAAFMTLFNEAVANSNSGVPFDDELIQNTISGTNPIEFPDLDLYSKEFVQPFVTTRNIITEFSGGNDKSQYYVNAGWNYNEAWVDINEDINAGTNQFNLRGNIDFKVNDWIRSSVDVVAIINTNKSSRANLLNAGRTLKPNVYSPFIPLDLIDSTNNPVLAGQVLAARTFNGQILGTTQQFGQNAPVAQAIAGGYQDVVFRSTQFNNSINLDLDMITEGLSAKTYLSFDFYDAYRVTIANQFAAYQPTWEDGRVTSFGPDDNPNIFGQDIRDQSENISTIGFISRLGFYGLLNYDKTFGNDHSINTTFLGYYNSMKAAGVLQTDIDSHLAFQLSYDYKKKLFLDFSGSYIHSIKLAEGNRGGLSPTAGIAYILSEEPFLKKSNFINYLKLKASGGIIKSDVGINDYFLYDENYSNDGTFTWADGQSSNRRQRLSQGANPNLGLEERIDLNIGFESYLMNSLSLEFNYFKTELDKGLTRLVDQYPSYYFNDFRPWDNFNKNTYRGFEIGINYKKSFNDLTVTLGANILQTESIATKRSEVNEFDYQNRAGRETSTIFGLVDEGFYSESDFTTDVDGNTVLNTGLPVPNFGVVQPGDIKYTDQNGDDIIDDDDRVALGQSASPFSYGVNLNFNYKAFNLFILGTGQTGADAMKRDDYFRVDGNDKYSEVVLGRWTPETADTATFPRLTSVANQNNFRDSSFWLYDNSFFRINRAQLTYEFDDNFCNKLGLENFSLNFQGTNILEIAKNRDIRELNIGSDPQFRSYTLGLRVSF